MTTGGDGPGDWAAPGSSVPPPGWSAEQPPPAWAPPPPPAAWSAPPTWGPAPSARPGIIPLRPLSVGEILDGAFTAMRRYPRVTLGLAAVVAAVQQLVGLVIDISTGNVAAPTATAGFSGVATVPEMIAIPVNLVLSAVLAGMITLVIGDAVLGRPATAGMVWGRLRPMFWPLVGAAVLVGVLTFLGLLGCIVGIVFPWVVLAFTTPALLLERLRVGDALRRSWRLTLPAFWRLLGIRLLAWLLVSVITFVVTLPALVVVFAAVAHSLDASSSVHVGIASEVAIRLSGLVATTITAPFAAGVLALLYIDRRMRAEALDLALVRAAATAA
jgi:hypothetical protein